MLITKRLMPKLPNLLIGMIIGSVLALFMKNYTEIKLLGEIPAHLPPLSHPEFSFQTIRLLAPEALMVENSSLKKLGGGLYFVDMKSSVYEFSAKSCFIKKIDNNHFFKSKPEAIASIYEQLDKKVCSKCNALIFKEYQ